MTTYPIPLADGYTAEFDLVDSREWYKIMGLFSDANLYQTWAYDAVRCGEKNISHFVLRLEGKIIAAAQARIMRLPLFGFGAAYIRWGPLWQLRNENADSDIFKMVVRALRNEYVFRRGLILRIAPALFSDNSNLCSETLRQEGYTQTPREEAQRTLILDLEPPLNEIRKNFNQKWRNCLNNAERNQLEIVEGTEDGLFNDFIGIYRELLQRKQFKEPNDINEFRMIQRELPDEHKMGIFQCRSDGTSCAGAIFSAIGDTGVYLFGATNADGMKNKSSYLLQWKAIQWMKNKGCRYYNLNGINPITNPGGYHFKTGVAGKRGRDIHYLGRFDCYSGMLTSTLARIADMAFPFFKKIKFSSGIRIETKH